MKLLILGGTVFLGRHIVEAALARGHEVTLFNRGQHNSDLFPEVEKLRGDRDGGLSALESRYWDAAVDTSGYFPRVVRAAAEKLAGSVDRYSFISSISVYSDFTKAGMDERAPVGTLQDEGVEEITAETYGPLKVLCERAAEQAMPGRVLIVRPGYIVGPHDPTDRFTYWPYRVARGGAMLAPGKPDSPLQFIDVRDLSSWIVRMIEDRQTGVYNATGPNYTLTMQDLLETCRKVSGSNARFVWVSESFLAEHNVELPIWAPSRETGVATVDCNKAFEAGLVFRPLSSTVRDTLGWREAAMPSVPLRAGLRPEQEARLLQAWHEQQQS
ncbi:MAG TPA: SDR family oxidoreductase [Ktedonobacteraceae bacterium]|nr:SDR family oxidoreductase [Ktedonobacteraceae bacterium]